MTWNNDDLLNHCFGSFCFYAGSEMYCPFLSVKLSIKSFKVPELFIDMPENATVGSLKVHDSLISFYFPFFFATNIMHIHYFICSIWYRSDPLESRIDSILIYLLYYAARINAIEIDNSIILLLFSICN